MKRIPRVDTLYWVMIISANTIGEAGGDLISMTLNFGYLASTIVLIGLFVVASLISVITRTQHPSIYWTVIILSSTAGTTLSDYVTRTLGLGYGLGTLVILAALAVIFLMWRIIAPRDSIETSLSKPAEALYWAAILASSTLGTAFGDFLSNGTRLGFGGGSLVLVGVLAVIAVASRIVPAPMALFYWLAIIVTHPMGATIGDFMTKDHDEGGLQLGTKTSTIILTAVFLLIVAYRMLRERKRGAASDSAPLAPAPDPRVANTETTKS